MSGVLFGLGVGPGDPDLLTLKAHGILAAAPVIAYPASANGDSLARAIAAPHIPAGRIEIALVTPMVAGARRPAQEAYDNHAAEIRGHLDDDRDVAVLCQGDPLFYGSFMYLLARLGADYDVEIVPGVSSVSASAAVLGLPLVSRDDVLVVVPATLPEAELARRLAAADAAAIIKVGRHLDKVRGVLDGLGLAARAHYVERVGLEGGRAVTLADAPAGGAPYFSMVLVHRRGSAAT